MLRSIGFTALLAILPTPGTLWSQEDRPSSDRELLPEAVVEATIDFYNDPRRTRYEGPIRIDSGAVVTGDIAVLEGDLEVLGELRGSAVVINGTVRVGATALVTGDLLAVGGSVERSPGAQVRGEVLSYSRRLEYRREGDRIARGAAAGGDAPAPDTIPPPPPAPAGEPPPEAGAGEGEVTPSPPPLDFLVTTGRSYNRVEGLPVTFGPRLHLDGTNPLRAHALAIYRTEAGFTLDRVGYYLAAESSLGGESEWRVGATLHSLVEPIEDWQLTDLENGLAAFLFHQDFRDYYEREGLGGFVAWNRPGSPLSLSGDIRWERHRSLRSGSPLTLFENAEPWRAQPVVAEGPVAILAVEGRYDTRSRTYDPATGWHVRGKVEQTLDADLERPRLHPSALPPMEGAEPVPFGRFTTGFLDLRRYNRLSPDMRFNLRVLLGGSLTGSPLPPQRQHAMGGEGSLPGHAVFAQDCGARSAVFRRSLAGSASDEDRAYASYGCDAFGLVQGEIRGKLDFRFRLDTAPWAEDDTGGGLGWDVAPDWIVFVDGGRGWAFDDRDGTAFVVDVGAGLLIERIGIFVARPLSGGDRTNLFVRLGPRF